MSELNAMQLEAIGPCSVWVQTSCPRLSIDWGSAYKKPLLSPYEAHLACLDDSEFSEAQPKWFSYDSQSNCDYPMDFYSKSGSQWAPGHYSSNTTRTLSSNTNNEERKKMILERLKKLRLNVGKECK
jgi:2-(3-amino-3-carboxypropyl)histidine synthase